MPLQNVLFYTFSTIAQTLGALYGLLAAFLFFQLQSLRATMDALVTNGTLKEQMTHKEWMKFLRLYHAGKYNDAAELSKDIVFRSFPERSEEAVHFDSFTNAAATYRIVLLSFQVTSWFTLPTILFCIYCLIATIALAAREWLAMSALIIGVGGLSGSVYGVWLTVSIGLWGVVPFSRTTRFLERLVDVLPTLPPRRGRPGAL